MKNIRVLVAIIVLVATLLPSVAQAVAPVRYITIGANDSASGEIENWPVYEKQDGDVQIVDPFCGTDDQVFRAVLYENSNYGGDHVVLCRPQKNFCNVPSGGPTSNVGCWVFCCNTIQDKTSSVAVGAIKAEGACLRIFEDINFSLNAPRGWLQEYTSYPNMDVIPGGISNDRASSLKRVFAGQCP